MDRAIVESLSGKVAPAQASLQQPAHCRNWLRGSCAKGESCTFRHDPARKGSKPSGNSEKGKPLAKVAPAPERQGSKQGGKQGHRVRGRSREGKPSERVDKRAPDDPKKAQPCYLFANGKCTRGANCSFEHRKLSNDERERMRAWTTRSKSRDKDRPRRQFKPHSSPAACAAYLSGNCAKGHMCRLAHVDISLGQAIPASPAHSSQLSNGCSGNGENLSIRVLGRQATSSKHAPALVGRRHAGFVPCISSSDS
jgi:hypothetical protein